MSKRIKFRICFGAHHEWWGALVRWILKCPYNHVFLAYKSVDWDRWMVIEVMDKVYSMTYDEAKKRYYKMAIYRCSHDLLPGMRSMAGYMGSDYDRKGMVGGLFKILLWRFLRIKILKPFHNTSRLFCTEHMSEIMQRSSMPGVAEWEASNISPLELLNFVMISPECTLEEEVVNV